MNDVIPSERDNRQADSDFQKALAQRLRMRWVFFCVFLTLFVLAFVGTGYHLFVHGAPTKDERGSLMNAFVIEVGVAIIVLFYNVFGLKLERKAIASEFTRAGKTPGPILEEAEHLQADIRHAFERSPFPEKIFTFIALLLGAFSAVFTISQTMRISAPTWSFAVNYFAIFCVLLILTLFFFLRYRQLLTDYAILSESSNKHISLLKKLVADQVTSYHQVMHNTKFAFEPFGTDNYPHRFAYKNENLRVLMERSLNNVIATLLRIVQAQLAMRRISERVSLSIKAKVNGGVASALCVSSSNGAAQLDAQREYIVTLARDADAEREVRTTVYPLNENTDFKRALAGDIFRENDLLAKFKKNEYFNNNPDWQKYYNASLVVPIAHKNNTQEPLIYGFLTIDSLNLGKHELFTAEETLPIMSFGAELLALVFLNLEIFDQM